MNQLNQLIAFFKKRKNRDILLYVSSGLALSLPVASYLLEEQQGGSILWLIYVLSPVCFICVGVAIIMLVANCWISIGRRLKERKER